MIPKRGLLCALPSGRAGDPEGLSPFIGVIIQTNPKGCKRFQLVGSIKIKCRGYSLFKWSVRFMCMIKF